MKKNLGFRMWFYFRNGWATYFAVVFSAINTLVTTYYLAIERITFLNQVFTSFLLYCITVISIGVPILIFVGYAHYKRTNAYSSEADITVESNPYTFKLPKGYTQQVVFPLYQMMTLLLVKVINKEELSNKELDTINELQKKIQILIDGGSIGKK